MNLRIKIEKIMKDYTSGVKNVEETNAALKAIDAGFTLNIYKNAISTEEAAQNDERNGFGMLDTGTGTLDKVEIKDMKLVHSVGAMGGIVLFNKKSYEVAKDGVTLVESGVNA